MFGNLNISCASPLRDSTMASISPTTITYPRMEPVSNTLNFTNTRFSSTNFSRSSSQLGILLSRGSDSSLCCRCGVESNGSEADSNSYSEGARRWEFDIQETIRNALKRFDGYWSSFMGRGTEASGVVPKKVEEEEEEWGWERWKKQFVEVDEQERLASILKYELGSAIEREDYADAARIKIAIAAVSTNDTVGRAMSHMKKFVEEEQYGDAALIRDFAGTGLVGWWAGISEDSGNPYGRIIRISAEYGRYIARSYSPRQLATASDGSPLFEVYLRHTKNGNYQQQAVYLKRKEDPKDFYSTSFQPSGTSRKLDSNGGRNGTSKLFERSSEEMEDVEDGDDDSGFDNALQDLNPGLKVKVVEVIAPEKLDPEIISKVIEQIIDKEEGQEDGNLDTVDGGDESQSELDEEHKDYELDSGEMIEEGAQSQISVKVVVSDVLLQKISHDAHSKDLLRIPATLEKKGRMSFTFTLEEDANDRLSRDDEQSPKSKRAKLQSQQSIDHVLVDLMKSIGKGKIPMKVLRDVGELVNLTLNQARNRHPLSGSTTFNRIDVSSAADPLNGIYIGSHGLYSLEVIHMKRRFGQWKDDGSTKNFSKLEFYEYVEAVKLTGNANVPAGQVTFRAKVGKGYQLPHKGIIPEEFGVIARYRGQGRLADPGFQNPRWVDGELVILDGKFSKGGPIVGFVYWAPENHFLVFFNRLRMVD